MAYFTDVDKVKCVLQFEKNHLQENPFTSGTSRLLKLVAFVPKGTIIWADEKVMRLRSTFMHHFSIVCRNPQDGQAGNG
jgi:hypothetical protein